MVKMVADHGDIKRGLEIEHYAQEAVIHWNAPPGLAKSRGFCEAALKHQFTDHKGLDICLLAQQPPRSQGEGWSQTQSIFCQ
jgi:hypothetical protein